MEKLVSNVWQQKPTTREALHATTKLDEISTDDSTVQSANNILKVVYLDSTGDQDSGQANDQLAVETFVPSGIIEEEHDPAPSSPAKSSISGLLTSNFYNPEEF